MEWWRSLSDITTSIFLNQRIPLASSSRISHSRQTLGICHFHSGVSATSRNSLFTNLVGRSTGSLIERQPCQGKGLGHRLCSIGTLLTVLLRAPLSVNNLSCPTDTPHESLRAAALVMALKPCGRPIVMENIVSGVDIFPAISIPSGPRHRWAPSCVALWLMTYAYIRAATLPWTVSQTASSTCMKDTYFWTWVMNRSDAFGAHIPYHLPCPSLSCVHHVGYTTAFWFHLSTRVYIILYTLWSSKYADWKPVYLNFLNNHFIGMNSGESDDLAKGHHASLQKNARLLSVCHHLPTLELLVNNCYPQQIKKTSDNCLRLITCRCHLLFSSKHNPSASSFRYILIRNHVCLMSINQACRKRCGEDRFPFKFPNCFRLNGGLNRHILYFCSQTGFGSYQSRRVQSLWQWSSTFTNISTHAKTISSNQNLFPATLN